MLSTEKIQEYRVIVTSAVQELGQQVNKAIGEGWQPFGSLLRSDQNGQWAQAIVKLKPVVKRPIAEPLSVTKRDG